jgi:universal stress protein E
MRKFGRILAVVDPTAKVQPALHRAAWLAGKNGATLELLVCYYNEYLSGNRLFDADSLRDARQEVLTGFEEFLDELARPLREQGIGVSTTVLWHHPLHEAVVRHAKAIGADIVFKDTHHHSLLARALFTHSDWALIRTCPSPLWLVKPMDFPAAPVFVAAVDPFHQHDKPAALDDEILEVGTALAQASGAALHAFHAYDPRIAVATATANAYIPVSLPLDEIEKEMHIQHEKRLGEITDFHGISREKSHLAAGPAHEELPALARELGASLVVMGAVARNRLKQLFIGSTAERTLEHLPCDLLIVKPGWIRVRVEDGHQDAA